MPLKLHLGCGKRHIPGWYHIDAVSHPHVDLVHAVDRLPMVGSDTVDVIYACHVLEHFKARRRGDWEARQALNEWHRVLRPGGTLRVAVPDLEALCRLYVETGERDLIVGPLYGGQDYLYNFHYTAHDYCSITRLLQNCNFTNVHRYDWRETEHADVDDYSQSYYPHMDKENGVLLSLNVEAVACGS